MTMEDGPPLIRALEARYYTDPSVFKRERERIFARTWQYACHLGEVERPGDYVTLRIADQGLFVIRGTDGALRAFYNVCQHRAHELLQGSGNRKQLVCPYHAWTYATDGKLKGARNAGKVAGFDRASICLTEVRLEVFCGFVFVNLDPEARPMAAWYPGAADDLRAFVPEIEAYRPVGEHSADEPCNWKLAIENYNECYHCRVVHPSFTKGVIAPDSVNIVPSGYTLRHSAEAVASASASYGFDPAESGYRVVYLWPTMAIQVYPGKVVNTYWWRPVSVTQTRVHRGWLAHRERDPAEILKIAEIDRRTTFAEDLSILESVQRGMMSRGYVPGPLVIDPDGGVDNELSIHAIHGWVREALEPSGSQGAGIGGR